MPIKHKQLYQTSRSNKGFLLRIKSAQSFQETLKDQHCNNIKHKKHSVIARSLRREQFDLHCRGLFTNEILAQHTLYQLYIGKVEDLQIVPNIEQFKTFSRGILKKIRLRTLNLSGHQLGYSSSRVIFKILNSPQNGLFSKLILDLNRLGDEGLELIGQGLMKTGVCHLSIMNNRITGNGLKRFLDLIFHNKTLISFNLSNQLATNLNKVNEQALRMLAEYVSSNQCFYRLQMKGCNLTSSGLQTFVNAFQPDSSSLRVLNISGNQIENLKSGVLNWLISKQFDCLDLSDNLLNDQLMQRLYMMSRKIHSSKRLPIYKLDLTKNKITTAGSPYLLSALLHNDFLHHLSLGKNSLHRVHFDEIQNNIMLSHLTLTRCKLELVSIEKLFSPIGSRQSHITHLNLQENTLSSNAIRIISNAFLSCQDTLYYLNLSHCEIEDESGVILADALHHQKKMVTLDLSLNFLASKAGPALVGMVEENQSIKVVILERNMIDPSTMQQIRKLMALNNQKQNERNVQRLKSELRHCKIKRTARISVAQPLESRQHLKQDIASLEMEQRMKRERLLEMNKKLQSEWQGLKEQLKRITKEFMTQKAYLLTDMASLDKDVFQAKENIRKLAKTKKN